MKIAICSLPGSGDYLLSNFLTELSFENSNYYFIDSEDLDDLRITNKNNLETSKKDHKFNETICNLSENEFVTGCFGIDNKKYLKGLKTIFLYRDIKYCLVSFGFLTKKLNIWKSNEIDLSKSDFNDVNFIAEFLKTHSTTLYKLYKKTSLWIDEDGVLKINYDKLNGDQGKEIQVAEFQKIAKFLDLDFSINELELKISNTLNKDSLFKNDIKKGFDFYHSKDFLSIYKKGGFKKLNKVLGYEKFKDFLMRKISFKKKLSFYDKYWKQNKKKVSTWSYGINIVDNLILNYNFKNVLDAGCGSGDVVRYLLSKGYDAKGIELSGSVLKDFAGDILKKGIVQQGSLMNLPFKDNEFDIVFSSEVLEHIDEEDIPKVVEELSRVCKEIVFLTISLRPSSNFNKYHVNLKPRIWWENQFEKHSFVKDVEIVKKLQLIKPNATVKEIMEIGPTKSHIHEMDWFINNPPYDLEGELEPWYFIFKKNAK